MLPSRPIRGSNILGDSVRSQPKSDAVGGSNGNTGKIGMLSEADTQPTFTDPAIRSRGWTEDLIGREETARAIDVIARHAKG